MPELRIYNLFISHAWAYNADYYKLVEMLNDAPNFHYRDLSVPEHEPPPMLETDSNWSRISTIR